MNDARTFTVDAPCPRCDRGPVVGVLLGDQYGHHQHTKYLCPSWPAGAATPCGWVGWFVPEAVEASGRPR